jgi:hypothetical protein
MFESIQSQNEVSILASGKLEAGIELISWRV